MSAASGMAPRPKDFLFRVRTVAAVTEVSVWPEGKDAPKGRRIFRDTVWSTSQGRARWKIFLTRILLAKTSKDTAAASVNPHRRYF